MNQINEGTTGYLSVTFKNKSGTEEAPASASYRIDDVATGTQIRAATSLTPATTVEITLTPADNRILNTNLRAETRRVTVVAGYGVSDQVTSEYIYRVNSLSGVSGNPPVIVSGA